MLVRRRRRAGRARSAPHAASSGTCGRAAANESVAYLHCTACVGSWPPCLPTGLLDSSRCLDEPSGRGVHSPQTTRCGLRGAAIPSGLLVSSSQARQEEAMAAERLRIGMIGCGDATTAQGVGAAAHAHLIAVTDADEGVARATS